MKKSLRGTVELGKTQKNYSRRRFEKEKRGREKAT